MHLERLAVTLSDNNDSILTVLGHCSEFNHGRVTFLKKPCIMASLKLSSTKRCADRRMGLAPNRFALELPSSMTRRVTDESTVIVSYMGLIVGCAAPLWISDCFLLTIQIMCGSFCSCGESYRWEWATPWELLLASTLSYLLRDKAGRTIEGSMAMLLSMSSICLGVFGTEQTTLWLPVVVFAPLMEALTLKIDNVVFCWPEHPSYSFL
jgi:hypothetical protein